MKTIKENPFTYFKEIKRQEMNFGSMCKLHNDSFVSYCKTTNEPLCVKCILIYSRKETPMEIVSLSELQESLFKDIQKKYNIVQNQIKNIEKVELKDYDEDELKSLKQKGLRKLQETKEQIIGKIHEIFTFMKAQWNQLFDENFNIQKKRNDIVHELNLLTKIFIKALKSGQKIQNQPELKDLKELIETDSMVKETDFISKRVRQLIQNLQKLQTVNRYPEMTTNSLIISKVYEELKYLFDYNIDYSIKKQDMKKVFKFKFSDFYKQKNQSNGKILKNQIDKYENDHKFVPIIAKNRRLMVYDISVPNFKELMLSEIHSIPQGNTITIPSQFNNRVFIIGGHLFKNPQSKVFELDTFTQEFRIHPSMKQPRWLHQATPYKNYIYVTGGTDSEKEVGLSSVERYDIINEVWERLPDMKNPRHSHCTVLCTNMDRNQSHDNSAYLYVFGGIGTNNRYMNTIEKFDIERNSWTEIVFQNSFDLDLVRPFGVQINNQEILLLGGFKYYQSKDSVTNDFILYPFNNQEVYKQVEIK